MYVVRNREPAPEAEPIALNEEVTEMGSTYDADVITAMTNHISDTLIHMTAVEKLRLELSATAQEVLTVMGNKAEKTTLDGHIEDSSVHVSDTEKATWNAKAGVATSAETQTGTATDKAVTPAGLRAAVDSTEYLPFDTIKVKTVQIQSVNPAGFNEFKTGESTSNVPVFEGFTLPDGILYAPMKGLATKSDIAALFNVFKIGETLIRV